MLESLASVEFYYTNTFSFEGVFTLKKESLSSLSSSSSLSKNQPENLAKAYYWASTRVKNFFYYNCLIFIEVFSFPVI